MSRRERLGRKRRNSDIVSATEIASWAWCPESWRLNTLGHEPENRAALRRGERRHVLTALLERWSARAITLGVWLLAAAILIALVALLLMRASDG